MPFHTRIGFYCRLALTPAFLFLIQVSAAQDKIDTARIKKELAIIFDRDQKVRKGDSTQYGQYVDSTNLVYVKSLIDKYGWPGKSFVGGRGNYTVWLVIQHADLETQEKCLPLMKASVE